LGFTSDSSLSLNNGDTQLTVYSSMIPYYIIAAYLIVQLFHVLVSPPHYMIEPKEGQGNGC
jgi:hypothetical protein